MDESKAETSKQIAMSLLSNTSIKDAFLQYKS